MWKWNWSSTILRIFFFSLAEPLIPPLEALVGITYFQTNNLSFTVSNSVPTNFDISTESIGSAIPSPENLHNS